MPYAFFFLLLALVATFFALREVWLAWWPVVSFTHLAHAYATNNVDVYGKRDRTTLRMAKQALHAPWLAFTRLSAALFTRDDDQDELRDGVFVGARPRKPTSMASVVDLTAEFQTTPSTNTVAVPCLDALAASPTSLQEAVTALKEATRPVLLHCAQGHGRTGLVAAAFLVDTEGLSADKALAEVQRVRPGVRLHAAQRQALRMFAELRDVA